MIRQYAAERLEQAGEATGLVAQHCAHYTAMAERSKDQMQGMDQVACLDRLEQEHDNLRAALNRAQSEMRLRLAGSLWQFWHIRGYLTEGRSRLKSALASCPSGPPELRAWALNSAGILAGKQGDTEDARACYSESLALAEQSGDEMRVASISNNLGLLALEQEDFGTARSSFESAVTLFHKLGDASRETSALINLGLIAHRQKRFVEAESLFEASLQRLQQVHNPQLEAVAYNNLGEAILMQGESSRARLHLTKSLRLQRDLGDRSTLPHSLNCMARAAVLENDWPRAARLFGAAEAVRDHLAAPLPPSDAPNYWEALHQAEAALGTTAFAALYSEGKAMTFDEAVTYAVGEIQD